MRRLLRTFAVRKLKVWERIKARTKTKSFRPTDKASMGVSSKVFCAYAMGTIISGGGPHLKCKINFTI